MKTGKKIPERDTFNLGSLKVVLLRRIINFMSSECKLAIVACSDPG